MDANDRKAWLRLHLSPGLGRRALFRLIEHYGDPHAALAEPAERWCRCGVRADVAAGRLPEGHPELLRTLDLLDRLEVTLVSFWDRDHYPELLRRIPDPPALLYLRGHLPTTDMFAVVGSRRASRRGKAVARDIARDLAAAGLAVVSGLARGIDTAAHLGALDAEGQTVAVLGCGIDRVYPPENADLFREIIDSGAILTEYPPGALPLAGHFPGRNRIISGLSKGVLIVEAAEGSGSLHTAEFALETGREVFAVPNPVDAPTSGGVNQLIKDGARVVTESRDILDIVRPEYRHRPTDRGTSARDSLNADQLNMLNLLDFEPVHIDEILRKCGLTPPVVSDILLHLELSGLVVQQPGGYYLRIA
ncbi:MAG: DNA-protecting protein DprA [Deltaproteobacteria bacterium]|nr:MAG: DNA-protecting protein DprA [Deltaproteobacteria bacterium]